MTPDRQDAGRPGKRSYTAKAIAGLGALGILSAIGTLIFGGVVDASKDIILDPLIVAAVDQTSSPNYIFPMNVKSEDAPTDMYADLSGEKFRAWATGVGGLPYGDRSIQVTIRGRDSDPVIISSVRVRSVKHSPPPTNNWVNAWEGCGGVQPVRQLFVDFSKDPPSQSLLIDGVEKNDTVFQVSNTDIEVFQVDLKAGSDLVSWVIDVQYSSRSKSGTLTVTDTADKPFLLAGGGGSHRLFGSV
jgi:hypothetical protein